MDYNWIVGKASNLVYEPSDGSWNFVFLGLRSGGEGAFAEYSVSQILEWTEIGNLVWRKRRILEEC